MKLKEIAALNNLDPQRRALQSLALGEELAARKRKPPAPGTLPTALRKLDPAGPAGQALRELHGIATPAATETIGLKAIGSQVAGKKARRLFELTTRSQRDNFVQAVRRAPSESIEQVAIRRLAVGMLDRSPLPRLCSAFGYWQATGARQAAVAVLQKGLQSGDEEQFLVAATALNEIDPALVKPFVGTAQDDARKKMTQRREVASLTVLIHGTFSKDAAWYQPGGDFHTYVQKHVYPDVYAQNDFFWWSGRATDAARSEAADKLIAWCAAHPAKTLRLMGHSHGANVANLATRRGLQACTVITLSPPVLDRYLPSMGNISSGRFFNTFATIDLVVTIIARARQSYSGTTVAASVRERRCALSGHSASHDPARWQAAGLPAFVHSVCTP